MSYAEVAARNADQSPEEARAPPLPEIISTEPVPTQSLVDVDSSSVIVVPSDFSNQAVKTETQATRIEQEQEAAARRAAQEDTGSEEHKPKAKEKAKRVARKAKGELPNDPVELANGLLVAAVLGFVGYGVYRRYAAGELSWKVAGIWGAGFAAFAVVDVVAARFVQEQRGKSQE